MIFQAIFLQVLFFFGLVLVLRKILISSSYNETKRLQQLNEENSNKSQELAAKIADAENEYREKMLKTDEEIRHMKAKAKKEIEDLKEAIITKGKAEGDRIVTQALNARDEIRAEIEEQLHGRVVEFSSKIFRRILSADEQKLVHEGLLKSVFQELEDLERDRLQAVNMDGASKAAVEVKTSHPMTTGQKAKLEEILSSKFDKEITVEESVEKEIIAGIVITLGSFVIDASLAERFKKAAQNVK
ncbi:MAG: F0F1 ATP synthase subunit delta [Candidatus Omnitrophica bacterium]|nr:F0F1 ATP synthase subunit delta [Candidatus Omnitrophota bacterium]MCK5259600.1 F0F1 ATP synthase subunit delta [Candidatus Omnitrophota bacterium]